MVRIKDTVRKNVLIRSRIINAVSSCYRDLLQYIRSMVVYVLYVKADLDGVELLTLQKGTSICVSVRNPLDQTEVREKIVIDGSGLEPEGHPIEHAKHIHHEPPCHFALKWKDETTRSTIKILDDSDTATGNNNKNDKQHKKANKNKHDHAVVREMTAQDSGRYVPMLALDCQGIEPYAFHPMGGEFLIRNTAGDSFDQVDLSDGDWSETDLSHGLTSITNLQTKFE